MDKSLLDVAVNLKLSVVDVKDSRVTRAEKEALLDPYEVQHPNFLAFLEIRDAVGCCGMLWDAVGSF